VGNDTTSGNGSLDKAVKFFVTSNCETEGARGDALHLEVFAHVSCELEDLGGEVLKDSGGVNGSGGTNSVSVAYSSLQVSVDTANGELKRRNYWTENQEEFNP
jgi:hypothetical protein